MKQKAIIIIGTLLVILIGVGLSLSSVEDRLPALGLNGTTTTVTTTHQSNPPQDSERKSYEDSGYGFAFTYASHLSLGNASWEGVPMDHVYLFGDDGFGPHSFSVISGNRNDSTLNKTARSLDDYMRPYVSEERYEDLVIRRKISILEQEKIFVNGNEAIKQRYSAHVLDKNGAVSDPMVEGTILGNVRYVLFDGSGRFVIFDTYDPAFDITQDPEVAKTGVVKRNSGPLEKKRSELSLEELNAMANSFVFK